MRFRRIGLISVLLLVCLSLTPNVHAQTPTTSVSNLQYPNHALFQNGQAVGTVTFMVAFSDAPVGGALIFGVFLAGTTSFVGGSGSSTPDSCVSLPAVSSYANHAVCAVKLASNSGTESATFSVTLNSTQQYNLWAVAIIVDQSASIVTSSFSKQAFAITVSSQVQAIFEAQPANATLTVTVDGVPYTGSQLPAVLAWDPGSSHVIEVNNTIQAGSGIQYAFVKWSDGSTEVSRTLTATQDVNLTAIYKMQYQLTVTAQYGIPLGGGWYDSGSQATFSVASPQPEPGFMGILGGKYSFLSWTGDSTAVTNSATITMDGPKTVTATWSTDNTLPYILLSVTAAVIIVIVVVGFLMFRRRTPTLRPGQPQDFRAAVRPMQAPAQGMRYCRHCGKPVLSPARFCRHCGKQFR